MSAFNSKQKSQAQARDLKHRVLTCIHKLSDRDTHSAAASELESIARSLSTDALSPFLSSIAATDSSDKSPVRRQCLNLISLLSEHHGNSLSPHLSKLLTAIVRRLRDPDSSVRSACVSASLSLSSHLTAASFASITKPFLESLFKEQDSNAQTGAALCLVSIIEGSQNPDTAMLKRLLPRFEKLAKCESFKAKAALLTLIGSVVELDGVLNGGGKNLTKNLVACLVQFLNSDDWAARKAAAEALIKIVGAEKYALSEYRSSCLKTFEAKRFDKVKAVRETMNQMIDAWKEIPDLSEAVSPPAESQALSKESPSDGHCLPGSKTSCTFSSTAPVGRKRVPFDNTNIRTPSADDSSTTTARKRSPLGGIDRKTSPAMFRKLDRKKPSDGNIQTAGPGDASNTANTAVTENTPLDKGERVLKTVEEDRNHFTKPQVRRALFKETSDEKKQIYGIFKHGSRVIPCDDEGFVISDGTGDPCRNQSECEDLSLIRKQLVQIENQQSNLMDLLQKFIGSSHSGMRSLETRVHGLELALDEISYDLAFSTGRMSRSDAMCCKLPGAEFLTSKLWKKTEAHLSTSRFPVSGANSSVAGVCNVPDRNVSPEGFQLENRRYRLQSGRGFINPLAEISRRSLQIPEVSTSGFALKNNAA